MSTTVGTTVIKLDNIEQREKYTVSIIGCGRIGVLHACLFAEAGFKVICADTNQAIVDNLSKGKVTFLKSEIEPVLRKFLENKKLKVTTDLKSAALNSEIVIVAVPVEINEKGKIDYSNMERSVKQVGSTLRKGTLVVVASIVGVGAIESLFKKILEEVSGLKVGIDFYMAYSPTPFSGRQTLKFLSNCKRLVAAADKTSLKIASEILGTITKAGVMKTSSFKTAEAVPLFEAINEYARFSLVHELALFCEKAGLDYLAIQNLVREHSSEEFHKLTIEYGENHEAVGILLEEAENLNLKLKISEGAANSADDVLRHAVYMIQDALKSCGKTLRKSKISILGLSQTPNMMDNPGKAAKQLVETLTLKGAKISLYDPYLATKTSDLDPTLYKKSLADALEGTDCIVVLVGHDQFKRLNLKRLKLMGKMPAAVVDFEGVIEPAKAEAEGFIYRGLGRGVWTK